MKASRAEALDRMYSRKELVDVLERDRTAVIKRGESMPRIDPKMTKKQAITMIIEAEFLRSKKMKIMNKTLQSENAADLNLKKITQAIREAIAEKPYRKFHGYSKYTTAKTSFLIDESDFTISDWKWPTSTSITVHSHQTNEQTLNEEDVKLWRDLILKGLSTIDIVIFPESNCTMDVLAIEKKEENRQKLINFLSIKPGQLRKELGSETNVISSNAKYRALLRNFAKKYGLIYLENVSYDKCNKATKDLYINEKGMLVQRKKHDF